MSKSVPSHRWQTLAVLLVAALAGCGDGGTMGPTVTLADFAGIWTLTKWEFTSHVQPGQKFDLIAMGWTATITIDANGRFDRTNTSPGPSPVTFTVAGTFTIEGSNMIIVNDGPLPEPDVAAFTLTSDMFTLTSDGVFDTDFDGVPDVEGTLLLVWQRTT